MITSTTWHNNFNFSDSVGNDFRDNKKQRDCMLLSCHVGVPHSVVAWMSRNSLLETGTKSERGYRDLTKPLILKTLTQPYNQVWMR